MAIGFTYGPVNDEIGSDGHFRVPAHRERTFRVRRHEISWTASGGPNWPRTPTFQLRRLIRGIELPSGVEPLPTPPPGTT